MSEGVNGFKDYFCYIRQAPFGVIWNKNRSIFKLNYLNLIYEYPAFSGYHFRVCVVIIHVLSQPCEQRPHTARGCTQLTQINICSVCLQQWNICHSWFAYVSKDSGEWWNWGRHRVSPSSYGREQQWKIRKASMRQKKKNHLSQLYISFFK